MINFAKTIDEIRAKIGSLRNNKYAVTPIEVIISKPMQEQRMRGFFLNSV